MPPTVQPLMKTQGDEFPVNFLFLVCGTSENSPSRHLGE